MNILTTAAGMFASQPFHKVRLSDVAQAAGVGKGTLYTYFESKDDLYLAVFYFGVSQLVDRLKERVHNASAPPEETLNIIIGDMIRFGFQTPHLFETLRNREKTTCVTKDRHGKWVEKRKALRKIIETVIRQGVDTGTFYDPHPELTAGLIPGIIRSAMMEEPHTISRKKLTAHVSNFVLRALKADNKSTGMHAHE